MSRVDRAVRRARRHLAPTEALLACLLGVDGTSGRRGALVATDERLLLLTRRSEPRSVPYGHITKVDVDRTGRQGAVTVTASEDDPLHLTDIGDPGALDVFANLATYRLQRSSLPLRQARTVPTVRLVSDA